MVLQGFQYASWIGWVSGSYFVKKPWGDPNYAWISIYTLYALLFNGISVVKWVHFIYKSIKFFQHQSLVSKILNLCLLVGAGLFGLIFKLIFFFQAKKIVKFIRALRSTEMLVEPEVLYVWKWCKVLILINCVYQIGTAVALPFFFYRLIPDVSLSFLISPYYFISFFIFGSFPITSCFTVAYIFVIVISFHLLFAIEKIYADLNHWMSRRKLKKSKSKFLHADSLSLEVQQQQDDFEISTVGFLREDFITRLENIKQLCKQFDQVAGPFFLALFVRTVFFLIHSADAILIESTDNIEEFSSFKRFFGWIHLTFESSQLFLILIGNFFHERVAYRQYELEKSIFLIPPSAEKQEMEEILTFLKTWDWKMTACGIFIIDKQLISGVVSTMMTYVVILFQVNLSDPGKANATLSISY